MKLDRSYNVLKTILGTFFCSAKCLKKARTEVHRHCNCTYHVKRIDRRFIHRGCRTSVVRRTTVTPTDKCSHTPKEHSIRYTACRKVSVLETHNAKLKHISRKQFFRVWMTHHLAALRYIKRSPSIMASGCQTRVSRPSQVSAISSGRTSPRYTGRRAYDVGKHCIESYLLDINKMCD